MKLSTSIIIVLLFILLAGCGQEWSGASDVASKDFAVIYNPADIVERFMVQDKPYYAALYNWEMSCVASQGFQILHADAEIIVLKNRPICNGLERDGCAKFSNNTVYIYEPKSMTDSILSHEFVHVMAELDNSYHDKEPFKTCTYPLY